MHANTQLDISYLRIKIKAGFRSSFYILNEFYTYFICNMNSIDYIFILDLISMLNFAKDTYKDNLPYSFNISIENKYHKVYVDKDIEVLANTLVKRKFQDMDNCYEVSNINKKDDLVIITFSLPVEKAYFNVSTI